MTGSITGERIRAIRRNLGLSQVQLAELLDVSNITVSRWEQGRAQPHPSTIARLEQMERDDAPGEVAVARPAGRPGSLPRLSAPLIGRDQDLARASSALERARLVTIVGPAGAGKTSLALAAGAATEAAWVDGAWFVDLAAVAEPEGVAATVAWTLGLREDAHGSLVGRLQEAVRDRELLVILDNCEHVLAAVAGLAHTLLAAGGTSRLLTTSRVALGTPGEERVTLRPLAQADAAALFVQRVQEHQPELPLPLDAESQHAVDQICARLDGLPLAIELAAARARVLAIPQIASRLDSRFALLHNAANPVERQRTLQAAIAWSYDLLSPGAAALFRALGVFAGWSDLAAVEAVAATRLALDLLDDLARQSMVVVDHGGSPAQARYRLLESLAEFARDQLTAHGELAAVAARHAAYYGEQAQRLSSGLRGAQQATLLATLDGDHDNMLAALEWQSSHSVVAAALGLAADLGPYWQLRGRYHQGLGLLGRALAQPAAVEAPAYARALRQSGVLHYLTGSLGVAAATLTEAVVRGRQGGDVRELARALDALGLVHAGRRAFDHAQAAHTEARDLALAEGDRAQAALSTMYLGQLANVRGGNNAAERAYREAWSLVQGSGDLTAEAIILSNLGEVAARLGRYERALGYYRKSREVMQTLGYSDRLAAVSTNTAEVLLILGDSATAGPLSADAVRQFRQIGNRAHLAAAIYIEAAALAATGRLADALAAARESLTIYLQLDDWIDAADVIEVIARLLMAGPDCETAGHLLGGVARLREEDAFDRYPLFDIAAADATLARRLGAARVASVLAAGREMSRHDIAMEALHVGDVADGEPLFVLVRQQAEERLRDDGALTPRQVEILRLVADGMSNREIGEALSISARTVDRHLTAIFAVLDVDRRSAAVARATALGLLTRRGS